MFFEFDNISYAYDGIPALTNLSFSGEKGQIVGLIGENGAGKSTAIKNIVRFLRPDSGTIRLGGTDIVKLKMENYPISYIPDTPVFYEELSLMEHLQFIKTIYPNAHISIDSILDQFELREHSNKIPVALSKGTKQKLMIAMALLREYELLVADEPFSGLDPKQIAILKQLLIQQRDAGKLILLFSHLLDVVENICNTFVIIQHGKLLASGTKAELLEVADLSPNDSMESLYLKLVNGNEQNIE
ncbi:MAG: ABC transporter ATP-binding protein [Roseburia sp.]